jgi:putative transposase
MCRLLELHPSGYYAWKQDAAVSHRALDDQRLLGRIKPRHGWRAAAFMATARCATTCAIWARTAAPIAWAGCCSTEGLRAQRGYGRRPGKQGGKPAAVAPNHLQREFSVSQPNQSGSPTSPTSARMKDGCTWPWSWICSLARSWDGPCSRGSIESWCSNALLMAVWRRRPSNEVTVHSDQGSQFASYDWQDFLKEHGLDAEHEPSWQLPRQRRGRELLPAAQARTDPAKDLHDSRRGKPTSSTTSRCSITQSGATAPPEILRR